MFFGMFRKSNLFPSSDASFTPDMQFTRSDFILQKNHVSIEVKYSKTIQCKERKFTVKFPLLQSMLCPVSALLTAFCLTRLPPDAPAFISGPEGTPMSGVVFTKRLKEAVAQCGLGPRQYASHSFRRGSATWALACGVPGELVKSMGDWKSAVYLDYLDDLPESVWNSYIHQFSTPLPKYPYPFYTNPIFLFGLEVVWEGRGTLFTINCTFLETVKQEHVLSVFSVLSIKVMLTFARTKFKRN